MSIDLTPRWKDFAVYLPAIQSWYSKEVNSNKILDKTRPFPKGIAIKDLDYLNPKSKLWHYGYGLYSYGQFTDDRPKSCSVTDRIRGSSVILGDSGGYQIGVGTLKGTEHLKRFKTSEEVCEGWRACTDVRKNALNWLESVSDYAMTIDMPLWATEAKNPKSSPFTKCSVDELIQLTVENLKFIKTNRRHQTKWLNVMQGTNIENTELWWNAIKKYKFDGWALGGSTNSSKGLYHLLFAVLLMKEGGAFTKGQDWVHALGVSQPTWAVIFTAIQRELRKINPNIRVSYDSASPFQTVGKFFSTVRYPKYTKDMKSWVMTAVKSPLRSVYANTNGEFHYPFSSPIGELMTLDHLCVNGGDYQNMTADKISNLLLVNHTLYIYVRAFLEANELAFQRTNEAEESVPRNLLKAIDLIEQLFEAKDWRKKLHANEDLLTNILESSY